VDHEENDVVVSYFGDTAKGRVLLALGVVVFIYPEL